MSLKDSISVGQEWVGKKDGITYTVIGVSEKGVTVTYTYTEPYFGYKLLKRNKITKNHLIKHMSLPNSIQFILED